MRSSDSSIVPATFSRRALLKAGLGTAAGVVLPVRALGSLLPGTCAEKALSFFNTHTGESLKKVTFWAEGSYLPESLEEINYILRDHRADKAAEMDLHLLDLLHALRQALGTEKPFHIISGYRSPSTNQLLRKDDSRGVAKRSLHTQGRAIDVRVPGIATREIRKAALSLKGGGVGYYPESRFIHLDTGRVRFW